MKLRVRDWITLFLLSIVWGSSFILIKKGVASFTPFQVGAIRMTLAGLMLAPTAYRFRKIFPRRHLKWILLAALTGNLLPMFIFPYAQEHVSSAVAGVLNSTQSIFIITLGAIFLKMHSSRGEIIGVIMAFIGVLLLFVEGEKSTTSHDNNWLYFMLLLLATVFYAINTFITKRRMRVPAIAWASYIGVALIVPGAITLLITGFFHNFNSYPARWEGLGYIFILSFFGTVLANIYNYKLIKDTSPLFASNVALLLPVVALFWGYVDGEAIGWLQILGSAMIVAGLYFSRRVKKPVK